MATSARRPTQSLPPGLKTRPSNKNAHPAAAAGVAPKPRGTREEQQRNRQRREQEKLNVQENEAQARARAARIEEDLEEEDTHRNATANHPPSHNIAAFQPSIVETDKTSGPKKSSTPAFRPERDDSASSSDEYAQPDSSEDDDDDDHLQAEVVEEENQAAVKRRGKKSMFHREDITALRTSDPRPKVVKRKAQPALTTTAIKKHKKSQRGTAFTTKWVAENKAASARLVAVAKEKNEVVDDESLVQMGGISSDDDDGVEKAALNAVSTGPRGKTTVAPTNVKITPGHQTLTKTELRGGAKKWNLSHIPAEAKIKFSEEVVPSAKAVVGTLSPWATIDSKSLQKIMNEVFGEGVYEVRTGDAWNGLLSYRIQSWRNLFATKASLAVARYFDDPSHGLTTAEARLEAVKWWLDFQGEEGKETAPYQFKKCVEDEDEGVRRARGFCQAPFVIETFALAHLDYIKPEFWPQANDLPQKRPIGAMILSLQAVEHALREYEDNGNRNEGVAGQFSFDNYGDCRVFTDVKGRSVKKFVPRASRYIAPIKNLKVGHWVKILRDAQAILAEIPKGRKKGRKSSSTESLDAMDVEQHVKAFVVESDSQLSGSSDEGSESDGDKLKEQGLGLSHLAFVYRAPANSFSNPAESSSECGDSNKENWDPRNL
ncbi:hypothetical protein H0H92_006092, partial [Tricholoma furcatifolium]